MSNPAWYVPVDGKNAGPFTAEELKALVEKGKVSPREIATHSPDGTGRSWMRPIHEIISPLADSGALKNPEDQLFQTLQAAKVRKAMNESKEKEASDRSDTFSSPQATNDTRSIVGVAVGIALLAAGLTWAFLEWRSQQKIADSKPAETTEKKAPEETYSDGEAARKEVPVKAPPLEARPARALISPPVGGGAVREGDDDGVGAPPSEHDSRMVEIPEDEPSIDSVEPASALGGMETEGHTPPQAPEEMHIDSAQPSHENDDASRDRSPEE